MIHPDCVRIDADDVASRKALLDARWREIETLLVMECDTHKNWYDDSRIRRMRQDELPAVLKLMRENLGPNRLVSDPKIGPEVGAKMACQVRELYMKNNPLNIFVYDLGGIRGFLVQEDNYLKFMAVDKKYRGDSIGSEMTDAFICRCRLWGYDKARLGTQDTNLMAIRLYTSRGFQIVWRQRTFHK